MLLLHRAPDDVERLLSNVRSVGCWLIGNLRRFLRENSRAERREHYDCQNQLFHKASSYRDWFVVTDTPARQRSRSSYMRTAANMKAAEKSRLISRPSHGIRP